MTRDYLNIRVYSNSISTNFRCHRLCCHSDRKEERNTNIRWKPPIYITVYNHDILNAYVDRGVEPIISFANKRTEDGVFYKQFPFECIESISSDCFIEDDSFSLHPGKILVTVMIDGKIKEFKCDELERVENTLTFKNPKRIDCVPEEFLVDEYNVSQELINKIQKKQIVFDSLDIVKIEPYPEELESKKTDDYVESRYDIPIGTLWGRIYSSDNSVQFSQLNIVSIDGINFCSSNRISFGKICFNSRTEMFSKIKEWDCKSKNGVYPLQVSEIIHDRETNVCGFRISSNVFTYIDLEEKLGIDIICVKDKIHTNSIDYDYEKWIDDAYEGYSPEYLGID